MINMKKILLFGLMAISSPAPAADCIDFSRATQETIIYCKEAELARSNLKLKLSYQHLYAQTEALKNESLFAFNTATADLKASQEAWENYKDKQCLFLGVMNHNTSMGAISDRLQCKIGLTNQRIVELRDTPGYDLD